MRPLWTSAIASAVFFVSGLSSSVSAINLYNGTANQTPDAQLAAIRSGAICTTLAPNTPPCNAAGNFPFPTPTSQTVINGVGVRLNTAANLAEYSGYSNFNPSTNNFFNTTIFNSGTLNRVTGYSLDFKFRLDTVGSEVDNTNPRAVFSVLVVSSDNFAIELGFRVGEIFAQSSNFTAEANSAAFTTTALKDYRLTVSGSNYLLDEVTSPTTVSTILSGLLVQYTFAPALSDPPLPFNPYTTPSFVFLGDNSGQASGEFTLGSVDLTPIPFDFSPTGGLLTLGAIAGARHIRKKIKEKSKS